MKCSVDQTPLRLRAMDPKFFLYAVILIFVDIASGGPLDLMDTLSEHRYPALTAANILDKKAGSLIPIGSEFVNSRSLGNSNRLADVGPSDLGHEMHAKMEEAVEHALAIINGAAKFAEEAQLEQESLPGKSEPETRFKRAIELAATLIDEKLKKMKNTF